MPELVHRRSPWPEDDRGGHFSGLDPAEEGSFGNSQELGLPFRRNELRFHLFTTLYHYLLFFLRLRSLDSVFLLCGSPDVPVCPHPILCFHPLTDRVGRC